jgi:hypothetical protein
VRRAHFTPGRELRTFRDCAIYVGWIRGDCG